MAESDYRNIVELLACPFCSSRLELYHWGVKCLNCGKQYCSREGILSFCQEKKQYWEKVYSSNVKNMSNEARQVGYYSDKNFSLVKKVVNELLEKKVDCKVLDVGCGHGLMSGWLTKKNQVIGVDFSLEMLKVAQERGLIPLHADGMKLPLGIASFDIVISIEVIQHIDDYEQFILHLSQFVKPGGQLLISGLSSHSALRKINRAFLSLLNNNRIFPKLNDPIELAKGLVKYCFEVEIAYACFPLGKVIRGRPGYFKKNRLGTTFFVIAKNIT